MAGPESASRNGLHQPKGLKMEMNRTRQRWFAGLLACALLVMPASAAQSKSSPSPAKEAATATNSPPRETSAANRPVYGLQKPIETYEPKSSSVAGVFMRLLGAMAIIISLLLLGAWWFRKSRLIGLVPVAQANLKIIETRSLASRHALHVVEYGEQRFLIADSPAGTSFLTHLDEVAEAEDDADNEPKPGSFAAKLKGFLDRKKS
jgi:flagellar biogenesis protein FliO